MTAKPAKRKPRTPPPPARMGYPELAAHLGVSRRTLVRYVTSGRIPSPVTNGTVCEWTGEDLFHAMSGPGIPGCFEYLESKRERNRKDSIIAKKLQQEVKTAIQNGGKRKRKAPSKGGNS